MKYLCRGACSTLPFGNKDIPVKSGSTAKDQRFSLKDDTAARVFTVTITDLRSEDAGQYWCGIQRSLPQRDVYTEILLHVEMGSTESTTVSSVYTSPTSPPPFPTTESIDPSVVQPSTPSLSVSASIHPETAQQPPSPGFIILYVLVSLLFSGFALSVLVLFCKRRRNITTSSVALRSLATERNIATNEDTTNNENDPPENDDSTEINPVYHTVNSNPYQLDPLYTSVKPKTIQIDPIYLSENPSTNQSDPVYQSLNRSSSQSDPVYQSLNRNSSQSDPVYQSLNCTSPSDSVYQTLNPSINQSDPVYHSINLNTNQSDSLYQSLNPNTNQSDSLYQSLNHNTNQSDSVYQSLNHNTNQSDSV
uniref:Immunoglobulin V-set domain-containing protein n=1 Tax=Astyanax mexicanus TaxID=7994 RepID=A0A3B1IV23_ASTMX